MARSLPQSAHRYPLTIALGSEACIRVARELAMHGGQLSNAELVRNTRLAPATVPRALTALIDTRLVRASGSGRSRLYHLRHTALTAALTSLFVTEAKRFDDMLEAARRAAWMADPGALALWLYGSIARGDDGPASDLDLTLVLGPAAPHTASEDFRDRLARPGRQHGFDPKVVTLTADELVRLTDEKDPWMVSMRFDVRVLFGTDPDQLTAMIRRARNLAA